MKRPIRASRVIRAQARELRRVMTPAETQLWAALREPKIGKFRRQHPMDRFILDFYCPAARLCIELDGEVHDDLDQRLRDCARTEALALRGIRVLRFTNDEVLSNMSTVLQTINERVSDATSPLPLVGEGGEPERSEAIEPKAKTE